MNLTQGYCNLSVNYSNKGECVNISAQSDSSEDKTPDTDFIKNIIKNLTEEGDEFKKKLTTFGEYKHEIKYTSMTWKQKDATNNIIRRFF